MGSRNPRKIGMGVPNILGFVERECRKMGVPIFCDTGSRASEVLCGGTHPDPRHAVPI